MIKEYHHQAHGDDLHGGGAIDRPAPYGPSGIVVVHGNANPHGAGSPQLR
jgi:hypothetical protein